jgi:hypothetical protein
MLRFILRPFQLALGLFLAVFMARDLYPESPPEGKALASVLRLEHLKLSIAAGAAANTNIAVADIEPGDRIIGILNLTDNDLPANPTIQIAGQVRSTVSTAGDVLLVIWVDCTAD